MKRKPHFKSLFYSSKKTFVYRNKNKTKNKKTYKFRHTTRDLKHLVNQDECGISIIFSRSTNQIRGQTSSAATIIASAFSHSRTRKWVFWFWFCFYGLAGLSYFFLFDFLRWLFRYSVSDSFFNKANYCITESFDESY